MSLTTRYTVRATAIALVCLGLWASLSAVRMSRHTASPAPAVSSTPHVPAPDGPDGRGRLPWPQTGQAAIALPTGATLSSPGPARPVPIASVAKMMTAYLVLRAHPLDGAGFTVTITDPDVLDWRRRAANDESVVPVAAGEVLDERHLLEGLLLPSGNNIAVLLAVHDSGGVAAFVAKMNAAARSLGMRHTTYTDPSGLDPGTVSTARDQLVLLRAAMRNDEFAALVATRSAHLPVAGTVHNTNPLLGRDGFVGAKTGSDDAAGGCLAFVAIRPVHGRRVTVLGVVLGQRGPRLVDAAAGAARALVDGAFAGAA